MENDRLSGNIHVPTILPATVYYIVQVFKHNAITPPVKRIYRMLHFDTDVLMKFSIIWTSSVYNLAIKYYK